MRCYIITNCKDSEMSFQFYLLFQLFYLSHVFICLKLLKQNQEWRVSDEKNIPAQKASPAEGARFP